MDESRFSLRDTLWVGGSLAAATAALTILFLAMRAVMDVGGMCAEGGPYQIEVHCPDGVPVLLIGSIWLGLVAVFVYVWAASRAGAPALAGLMWPALFLSLGWNFLEYAFAPPFGDGPVWGWLIPGVLFVLMGGVPLLWFLPYLFRSDSTPRNGVGFAVGAGVDAVRRARVIRTAATRAEGRLVDELERLDRLHRRGGLTDAEYETAKRRLLEES